MASDELTTQRFSIPGVVAASWDVYKIVFNKLFLITVVFVFPLVLIRLLTLHQFIQDHADKYVIRGFSLFMTLIETIPALIMIMLVARQLDSGESPLFETIAKTLLRLFKVFCSIVIFFAALGVPFLLVGAINYFLAVNYADTSAGRIAMLLVSVLFGIPTYIYAIIFLVYWMFAPMAALVRNKWLFSGLSYSFSLVRKNWWRMLLFGVLMLVAANVATVPSLLFLRSGGALVIIVLAIGLVAVTFPLTVYVTAFYTLEQNAAVRTLS